MEFDAYHENERIEVEVSALLQLFIAFQLLFLLDIFYLK